MSIIGTTVAITTVATGAINGVLEFEKDHYERKLSDMEGYNKDLNNHLSTLEGLRDKIKTFWDDENAEKNIRLIETSISKVKESSDRVQKIIDACKGTIEILDDSKVSASEIIDQAINAVASVTDL